MPRPRPERVQYKQGREVVRVMRRCAWCKGSTLIHAGCASGVCSRHFTLVRCTLLTTGPSASHEETKARRHEESLLTPVRWTRRRLAATTRRRALASHVELRVDCWRPRFARFEGNGAGRSKEQVSAERRAPSAGSRGMSIVSFTHELCTRSCCVAYGLAPKPSGRRWKSAQTWTAEMAWWLRL
jgi:hypothetical protein